MLRIAIAADRAYTAEGEHGPWYDDQGLQAALKALGHQVRIISWEDPRVDLQSFDAIYVSTTWSGCRTPDVFQAWLDACEADGRRRLINDRAVIDAGFVKKRYWHVLERAFDQNPHLASLGRLTPSRFFDTTSGQTGDDFVAVLAEVDSDAEWAAANLVLKPVISADGIDTYVYNRFHRPIPIDEAKRAQFVLSSFTQASATFQRLAASGDRGGVLLQPYMTGVEAGEYSLTFLERRCVLAAQKPPLFKGDGSARRRIVDLPDVPPRLLRFAEHVLAAFANTFASETISRTRLDLFDQAGVPMLCELETVDPNTNIRLVAEQRGVAAAQTIFAEYARVIAARAAALWDAGGLR
ncbi:hypothetical protein SD80_011935 [Scytonema tolypothrichoides VB-61278]|nr:hypothetical protein SD80_011935 [Scytonema tolypothrichoides VB-61278]